MQAVILAGGLATRLSALTDRTPKSMVRIGGRPFLEYQVELLRRNRVKDLLLCVGHLGGQILDYFGDGERLGVRISYSFDGEELLGTGGALRRAEALLHDKFFILYGDSYLLYDYRAIGEHFEKFDEVALLVVYRNENRYDRSNVIIENGRVKLYEKRPREGMVHIDAGLSILRKTVLELAPRDRSFDLSDLYGELARREKMLAYQVNQRFYEIGSPEGLREFRNLMERGLHDSNPDTCQNPVGWRRN
jgi:NDP-sugar pyrophosphorylase family protein